MSEPRPIDVIAEAGAFNTLDADKVRRFEEWLERWVIENDYEENEFLQEIRRLISEQIFTLEIGDGYRVVANGKVFRVTKSR